MLSHTLLRLPITARLLLAMVGIVLVTALGSTHFATRSLSAQIEVQLERMGQVYLDGLIASLMPSLLNGDTAGVERALDEALRVHQGLQEKRLVLLRAGQVMARADRDGIVHAELPTPVREEVRGYLLDNVDGSYWVWRRLSDERAVSLGAFIVVANLDISEYITERRTLWRRVVLLDLALAAACAWVGWLLMRRLLKPVDLLTRHLQHGQEAAPVPLAEGKVSASDKEALQLVRAYNRMAAAAQDREAMLTLLAQQEREAVLGRLAATLAHEVRNPLAGVTTAIETLHKFGHREDARQEALDFMERGMRALADVTDATLATHRVSARSHGFGPLDVTDIQRLVMPQAERAGVKLRVQSDLRSPVAVAAGEVRQVLLNLLLNAVKASAPGGVVQLGCRTDGEYLHLDVRDQGSGMPAELARSLEGCTEPSASAGLGVAVIVRLVQRLQGRVAVDGHSGSGTHISLALPVDHSRVRDTEQSR